MVDKIIMYLVKSLIGRCAKSWKPYSKIFLLYDTPLWSIAQDMKELKSICLSLNIPTGKTRWFPYCNNQCAFVGSHFDLLLNKEWFQRDCRYAVAYFHGKPGCGIPEFDICFENLKKYHHYIWRLQVSHTAMQDVVLDSGIAQEKVFLIPIGINLSHFTPQTEINKKRDRRKYQIPKDAIVVGSFQKDGVGWGIGMKPKWPKGPEVFLQAIKILKNRIPNLFVLLSGPARGFVKDGLKKLGVPYQHHYLKNYLDIAALYHCLDIYIVASREEGGPKSVLESMASCIPLVTTCVGQAEDLVRHGKNGWMVEVGDAKNLAAWAVHCIKHPEERRRVTDAGLITAQANTYESQMPIWEKFFQGFVT